jgi:flavin-dependent dehydrogenase
MKYEVAIIGGGLAGLCLAIQLADAQIKVVIFEKENYPFHKVCGEYISMESYPFIESLGMSLASLNLPMIRHLRVSAPNGKILEQPLGLGGFGISRYTLDASLASIAVKKGVQLMTNTKVNEVHFTTNEFELVTTKGNFQAQLVYGAYGKRAVIDQQLKRPRPTTKKKLYWCQISHSIKIS